MFIEINFVKEQEMIADIINRKNETEIMSIFKWFPITKDRHIKKRTIIVKAHVI